MPATGRARQSGDRGTQAAIAGKIQARYGLTDVLPVWGKGMVEGNGHPLSWSAIINGKYDRNIIQTAEYPGICDYLDRQAPDQLGIQGVCVTHVCCDKPEQSQAVAASAGIPCITDRPEQVIGQVDAVMIATDIGHEHLQRARIFVEAGVPLFIDKPLTDNTEDLNQFTFLPRGVALQR